MLDEKDLQAIAQMLAPISARLDKLEAGQATIKKDLKELKEDVEIIKERAEEVRVSTNRLIEWADEVRDALPWPIPKV